MTKAEVPIFTVSWQKSERETKTGTRAATPALGAAYPWPAPRGGVATSVPSSVSTLDSVDVSGKIGTLAFVTSDSENISCVTFLKPKTLQNVRFGIPHNFYEEHFFI